MEYLESDFENEVISTRNTKEDSQKLSQKEYKFY
jgi:hypothetical protein